jgi:hypothetical protein
VAGIKSEWVAGLNRNPQARLEIEIRFFNPLSTCEVEIAKAGELCLNVPPLVRRQTSPES